MSQQGHSPNGLEERIRALFDPCPPGVPVCEPPEDSPYRLNSEIAEIPLEIPGASGAPEAEDAADAWLATPNAVFGGRCPRVFLDGTDEEQAFIEGVIESIEGGAFS